MSSTLSEFQIIKRYFEGVGEIDSQIIDLGIGDDCSVVTLPPNQSLCFSLDTMVEGRHFPKGACPESLAKRVMAAALSDLAAMGAKPSFFTLSLTLPEANLDWLEGFSKGLRFMANAHKLSLVGGDTTRGPLTIGVQVHGLVKKEKALRRSGAKEGDLLIVTGNLGDAGAALKLLNNDAVNDVESYLLERYYHPTPRFEEADLICSVASSCIDVSDGLLADLRHISAASFCGFEVNLEALPISAQLQQFAGEGARSYALNSGDDYELLFTVSRDAWERISDDLGGLKFTVIGRAVPESQDIKIYSGDKEVLIESEGYKHFE